MTCVESSTSFYPVGNKMEMGILNRLCLLIVPFFLQVCNMCMEIGTVQELT